MSIFTLGATWINALLNTIWLSICKVIFVFINWLYQVFETVANVNLFSEEVFSDITSRIYIVMGIAMLFIFAYNLVLMIINPDDKKSTGSTTKLVKETIISLMVIVLLPTIFNYMYVFQGHVLSTNIIGQIIMGGIGSTSGDTSNCDPDDYECSCDFSQFEEIKKYGTGQDKNIFAEGFTEGNKDVYSNLVDACKSYKNDLTDSQRGAYSIAPTIFSAFYRPATYDMMDCEEYLKTGSSSLIDTDQKKQVCANFFYDIKMSKYTGNINAFVSDSYLNLTMSTDEGLIEFDWLFAIVAGGLAVWMFLCYAMEIGVRVAKLGVLQIISPIAVMMRIVPSKGGGQNQMYTKWFDELKNTYLDVFIRLVIIYFSLFAISLVPDVISTLFSSVYSGESNWFLQTLSLVIVILGILKFAQEAPELIKTFFGSSGRFSIRPKEQHGLNALRAGVYGATTGKGVMGKVGGFFSGTARGSWGGYDKAVKGLDTIRTERGEKFGEGTTFRGRMLDRARVAVGMETRHERDKRKLAPDEKELKTQNDMLGEIKKIKDIVKNAIEKDDSKVEFSVDGITGSYAKLHKIAETMLASAQNMEDPEEQKRAFNKYTEFSKHIEAAKKEISKTATTNLLNGIEFQGEFKDKDFAAVGEALAKLNSEGLTLSGLNGDALSSLEETVGKQAANISKKINESGIYDEKYRARAADSRMVRGEGKAEKK